MAMNKKYLAAALAIVAVMMMTTVLALLQTSKTIPSSGTIYAFKVNIYTDETGNTLIDTITWANVNPGGSATKDVYVRNDAGSLTLILSMTTDTWIATPSNSSDLGVTITWNCTAQELTPTQGVWARLTLTVPDNLETQKGLDFDVGIKIIGDQKA